MTPDTTPSGGERALSVDLTETGFFGWAAQAASLESSLAAAQAERDEAERLLREWGEATMACDAKLEVSGPGMDPCCREAERLIAAEAAIRAHLARPATMPPEETAP